MKMLRALLPAVAAMLLLAAGPAGAQGFGKNKVQYRDFDWTVIRTGHFEIYFYGAERQTALDAARMAERSYAKLSRALNHEIEHPVPVILYASHTDFQQTNVTEGLIDEGTGGITEMFKQRVFLPFTGSYAELEHVLTHELVHAFEIDMLYGDGLGIVANPLGFQPPLWLMEGLAEYLSVGPPDAHTRMWLRDGALEGYLTPIPVLSMVRDIRVYRFGQSLCDFIARHYGEQKLGDLLRRAPEARDMEDAIKEVIGIPMARLSELWTEEIRRTHLPEIANHQKPSEFATRLTDQDEDLSRLNLAPAISPKGDRMVFISDRSLYQDIYLASAIDGKVLDRLVKGERSGDLESLRYLYTSITWSPDEKYIAFAAKVGAKDVIYVFDVEKRKTARTIKVDVDGILTPSWSPDGRTIAFVGLDGGQSDLFLIDSDGSNLRRLTRDRYMDRDPEWSPDGLKLAFTTDRDPATDFDSLKFADSRVAVLDIASGATEVLPQQIGRNNDPCWSPDGKYVAFLSDRTGFSNIFAVELETGTTWQLTDVLTGIVGVTPESPAFSWSRGGDRMAFCAFTKGGYDIFGWKNPLESKKEWKPEAAPLASAGPEVIAGGEAGVPDVAASVADSAAVDSLTIERRLAVSAMVDRAVPGMAAAEDAGEPDSLLETAAAIPLPDTSSFKIAPYKTRFTRDFTVGGAAFASNVGFAGQTALSFSDILGNHQIFVAASVFGSITDSDLLFSYVNRRHRTNWGAALFQYRNDYLYTDSGSDNFESRVYRGVETSFSHPFNKFVRAEWALQAVSVSRSVYENWYYGQPVDEVESGTLYFLSPSAALVTDNVVFGYNGPLSGTRSRFEVVRNWGDLSSTTGLIDWRRYSNLKHRYVFATRAVAAVSEGRNPEIFRVGGPFTYRGSDWGDLVGSRVILTNVEFRYPLIDHLQFVFPLALDFRGIEGILFLDTASVWSDGHFRFWNNGRLEDAGAAYGFGARLNLGIVNLRYDLAQATDLARRVGGVRQFFTIGYDF